MNQQPRFQKRSFSEGIGWLGKAAELMSKGGSALLGVAAVFLLVSLIQALPVIGVLVFVLFTPMLTAGLLTVFRLISESSRPNAMLLFAGWSDSTTRIRLLGLGVWLLLGSIAAFAAFALWLAPQMDVEALNQFMSDPELMSNSPDAFLQLFAGVNLFGGMTIAVLILATVLGGLYFAVPLVLFWKWPVFSSLVWSLRAMLSNWMAFLGFGLVMLVVLFAAGFMFAILVGILGLALGQAGAAIGQMVILLGSLFIQLLFAATQWVVFEQIFDQAGSGSGDDQQSPPSEPTDSSGSVEL